MKDTVTVRVQKVKKSGIKTRLIFFLILVAILLLVTLFANQIAPYDPYAQDLSRSMLPPSPEHWMGTDRYGRDLFSRVLVGAQTSIFATLALVGVISLFGTVVGTLCGYYGGALDSVVMRISDVCLAFPGLVFALAIAALLGGGVSNAVLALAVISWPKYARVARSQTLALKNSSFVAAARLSGSTSGQMILRHILPPNPDQPLIQVDVPAPDGKPRPVAEGMRARKEVLAGIAGTQRVGRREARARGRRRRNSPCRVSPP